MEKVSIIVPNYNTEQYIGRCIESLVNQTYKNIEIIIVDDKSNDESLKIIKKYEEKFPNVLCIALNENKGVSTARNMGIKKATGDYIMFSDSDDWYELCAVEKMINAAHKMKSDFVTSNYYINKNNKQIKVNACSYFSKNKITKEEIISYMNLTSCSKLIKRDLFINNNILYPTDIKNCEELTVIPILAYLAEKPIAIDDALYNYYQREGSASNSTKKDVDFYEKTFSRFIKYLDNKKYKEEIEFRAIEHFLYSKTLVMIKSKYSKKEIKKHIYDFKNKYKNFINNKYLNQFSLPKRIFIKTISKNNIFFAKVLAELHRIITS